MTISTSKGFGLFQQLHYNLSLHFTPGLQSAFYTDHSCGGFCSVTETQVCWWRLQEQVNSRGEFPVSADVCPTNNFTSLNLSNLCSEKKPKFN